MALKIVFALVYGAALCCAQTDAPSPSGSAPVVKETPVPAPSNPPGTSQSPEDRNKDSLVLPELQPAAQAAPAGDQQPSSGKSGTEGKPAGKKSDTAHKAYVIGSLDVLSIKVWNNPNLSGVFDVGPDGMISMSLIGEIKADGLTEKQLKDEISEHLRDFFNNNPDVVVQVARNNSKRYFVYGGVLRGGEFPLNRDTTVMDALALVGGFKDFANTKKIRIQRGAKEFDFNYKDVSRGKHLEENILLENGDQIFVKE
jgi:polysaccharide export outer membrane protein